MRLAIAGAILVSIFVAPLSGKEISYRDAALEAARWISASAIHTDQGPVWPADPTDPKSVNDTLYAGTPGVILFFIETFRSTGDPSFLKDARAEPITCSVQSPTQKSPGCTWALLESASL
jgi:hypothetical protein